MGCRTELTNVDMVSQVKRMSPHCFYRTKGDMMGIADNASTALLRQIQFDIFNRADAHLPSEDAKALAERYVNQNTNRNQVARLSLGSLLCHF